MAEDLGKKIERLKEMALELALEKSRQEDVLEAALADEDSEPGILLPARQTGKSGRTIKRDAHADLKRYAEEVGIEQFELFPGNEYPTPFTRLPLFPPVQRAKAREKQAAELASQDFVRLNSRWDKGGVWKSGPALTVTDEDTLAALMKLRSMGFSGNELLMPSKRTAAKQMAILSHGRKVTVHSVYCVVSELESLIQGKEPPKKGWPGPMIKRRRESIERLASTVLKFEQPRGLDLYRGKLIPIIEVDWVGDPRNACYYVQFHPAIVAWLEEFRTFIDLDIRRELTNFGKALHRFLSSQISNAVYSCEFEIILEAIGYDGKVGDGKRAAQEQLQKMVELEFAKKFEFTGSGRSTPLSLSVWFR